MKPCSARRTPRTSSGAPETGLGHSSAFLTREAGVKAVLGTANPEDLVRNAENGLGRNRLAGAAEPGVGVLELGERRERLLAAPDAIEGVDALGLDDRVAEALAELVLAQLEVEAEQPLEELGKRRCLPPPALERLAQVVERGQRLAARRVHDVLGVALDHRHRRLDAIDDRALLGRGHD